MSVVSTACCWHLKHRPDAHTRAAQSPQPAPQTHAVLSIPPTSLLLGVPNLSQLQADVQVVVASNVQLIRTTETVDIPSRPNRPNSTRNSRAGTVRYEGVACWRMCVLPGSVQAGARRLCANSPRKRQTGCARQQACAPPSQLCCTGTTSQQPADRAPWTVPASPLTCQRGALGLWATAASAAHSLQTRPQPGAAAEPARRTTGAQDRCAWLQHGRCHLDKPCVNFTV